MSIPLIENSSIWEIEKDLEKCVYTGNQIKIFSGRSSGRFVWIIATLIRRKVNKKRKLTMTRSKWFLWKSFLREKSIEKWNVHKGEKLAKIYRK